MSSDVARESATQSATILGTVHTSTDHDTIIPSDSARINPGQAGDHIVAETVETAETKTYVEEKTLVTIAEVETVTKHPNADSLWLFGVQGYSVIVNIASMYGEESTRNPQSLVGRKVVYFAFDSVLPETFEKSSCWNYLHKTYMGRKIKTAKIRGVVSQGLILDFVSINQLYPDITVEYLDTLPLDSNLTNKLGVIKFYAIDDPEGPCYNPKLVRTNAGSGPKLESLRVFPSFLQKTDQPHLQKMRKILTGFYDTRLFSATQKFDGQSVTWFKNKLHVGVCSRNYEVLLEYDKEPAARDASQNNFRTINEKYNLFDKLMVYPQNIALQGEMYGLGINGNRHNLKTVCFALFDVYDIETSSYLPYDRVLQIAKDLDIPTVTEVFRNLPLSTYRTVDEFVALANAQRYKGNLQAEGIVVKTSDGKFPYISFKVISPEYQLKYGL